MAIDELQRDEKISGFLAERIEAGDFPSAVYLVAEGDRVVFADALGHAVRETANERRASLDTIYDLASLTKPLVTGLILARCVESGAVALDEEVSKYLPEFNVEGKSSITLRQLATHTSGLPAWRPLYITACGQKADALAAIAREPLEYEPATRVLYSDLGFITLGFLLERVSGATLDRLARQEIFEPLALERTFFNPEMAFQTETAACETGNLFERGMCEEMGDVGSYKDWREGLIWGEVHDGNAYFLGGAAGHAGLFSTARETYLVARQFLQGQTRLLKPDTCALFRTDMTEGLEEARSLAWQLAATKDSTAGPDLPSESFGHLGFTGTSCWIDPERERVFLLFTNRTHARSLPFVNINSVRRRFHTLAAHALRSNTKGKR